MNQSQSIGNAGGSETSIGEGDREAARRYDQQARDFVEKGQVDDAARKAQPASADEAKAMERAEEEGRARAKGEDPAVRHGTGGSASPRE